MKVNPQSLNLFPIYDLWEWQESAACKDKDIDPELFFLESKLRGKEKRAKEIAAKRICRTCPVITSCREHALNVPEFFGVWGGTTADEREELLRNEGRSVGKFY